VRVVDLAVRGRYVLFAALAAALSWAFWSYGGIDWWYLDAGGRLLFGTHATELTRGAAAPTVFSGGGLRLYAFHPAIQIGPLSLVIARALNAVFGSGSAVVARALVAAGVLPVLRLIECTARRLRGPAPLPALTTLLGGGCVVAAGSMRPRSGDTWMTCSSSWG